MVEAYVLGLNGETEAVFNADGSIKFFNINAGSETIGRFAPTPVDLYLSNTTLNGTYEAQNSITVENNVSVSGTVILKAGNSINLKPVFTSSYGSNFTAMIGTVPNTPKRFYYLKDHLGSIRVVVNETGDIVSSDDYDPWGMILNGRTTDNAYLNAKYKFTGKERDVETGYDYFGARYYDNRIGRWLQVDPLFEKYPGWSPFNYTLNNPLKFIDSDGRDVYGVYIGKIFAAKKLGGGFSVAYTYDDFGNAGLLVNLVGGVGIGRFSGIGSGGFHYSVPTIFDITNGSSGGFGINLTLGVGVGEWGVNTTFSTNLISYSDFDISIGNYSGAIALGGINYSFLSFTKELTKLGNPANLKFKMDAEKITILDQAGNVLMIIDINDLISANNIERHDHKKNEEGFYIEEQDNSRVKSNSQKEGPYNKQGTLRDPWYIPGE